MNQEQSKNSVIVNNTGGLPKNDISKDEYEYERSSQRTLILSSGDVESMAMASSRAKLMLDLVQNPNEFSREFGFNFHGRKSDNNPVHVTSSISLPKRVVPTYPSLVQNIRWNPSIELYSDESGPEMEEDQFHCWCLKCKMDRCQSRNTHINSSFTFKDNIMRFTDNSTMTSQLVDSSCEACTPVSRTPRTSEVNISTSDIDTRERVHKQTPLTYPIPILKKPDYDTCRYRPYANEMRPHENVNLHEEAMRDYHKCNDYKNLLNSIPKREYRDEPNTTRDKVRNDGSFRRSVYKDDSERCRKNIYNEGISDAIAEKTIPRHLGCPVHLQAPMKYPTRKDLSLFHGTNRQSQRKDQGQLNNKYINEKPNKGPGIPFAYRIQSKYHNDCREPVKKVDFRYDANFHHELLSDGIQGQIQSNRVLLCDRQTAKFPRKVLMSERDIDAFVSNRHMNMSASKFRPLSPC